MTPDPGTTILLMEDDPGDVRLEEDRLERSGYRVVTAGTAEEGLEKISDGTVGLIVLLEKLRSGESGLEFFQRVKAAGHHIPAILVTAAGDEKLLAQAIAAGVRDLVPRTEALSSHLEFIVTRVLDQARTDRELDEARIMARAHEARSRELEEEISRRKRLEQALREAVRAAAVRLKAIVDTAPDGIITTDEQGMVESFNPAAEVIFGYPRSEVLGKSVWMLISEGQEGEHARSIQSYLEGGLSLSTGTIHELEGRRHDGTTFPVELSLGEARLGDRRIFTGIVRDVTAYKKAIAERTRLLAELEAERVLLKDADQRKDQFLAVLAHELRNPLAPISNAAQIMKVEGLKGPNFRWSIEVIESQIKQMTHLIDDLLDVSRITRGKVVLHKQPATLGEVVELAIEASQPVIQEFRHHLDVALPPESVVLRVDVARMAQVLSNLLNNAAKYTDPGGEILLAAEVIDREIEIRVHDNGIGIAPELLPKVFDMFVQGEHTPSRARGGLGIGLTLVRSLVEQHEGRVFAHSDGPGQGTEVVVRLPFDASAGAPEPESGMAPDEAQTPIPARRILIVDDNRNHAMSLGALLTSLGQQVSVAYDGPTAIELAAEVRPDLMLVDIGLPGIDGYEVARRCKSRAGLEETVLIATTGYGKEEDRRRSREAGFDAHFVKAVVLDELRRFLEQNDFTAVSGH